METPTGSRKGFSAILGHDRDEVNVVTMVVENPALKDRTDTVYFGGPVDIRTLSALLLSSVCLQRKWEWEERGGKLVARAKSGQFVITPIIANNPTTPDFQYCLL